MTLRRPPKGTIYLPLLFFSSTTFTAWWPCSTDTFLYRHHTIVLCSFLGRWLLRSVGTPLRPSTFSSRGGTLAACTSYGARTPGPCTMADVWISRKRWTCKYCNVTINDDIPSRRHHENGLRHKHNVERALRALHKENDAKRRAEVQAHMELLRIEKVRLSPFLRPGCFARS